jgi:hypothetical protein
MNLSEAYKFVWLADWCFAALQGLTANRAPSMMFLADGDSLLQVVYVMIWDGFPPPGLGVREQGCRFYALWSVTILQGERL